MPLYQNYGCKWTWNSYFGRNRKEFAEDQFLRKRKKPSRGWVSTNHSWTMPSLSLGEAYFPFWQALKVFGPLWFYGTFYMGRIQKGSSLFLYFYPTAFTRLEITRNCYSLGIPEECLQDVFFRQSKRRWLLKSSLDQMSNLADWIYFARLEMYFFRKDAKRVKGSPKIYSPHSLPRKHSVLWLGQSPPNQYPSTIVRYLS